MINYAELKIRNFCIPYLVSKGKRSGFSLIKHIHREHTNIACMHARQKAIVQGSAN